MNEQTILHEMHPPRLRRLGAAFLVASLAGIVAAQDVVDLGSVRESNVMIPMRDGKRLSAYLYTPKGSGPWPAVFEQRYASLRGKATRQTAAQLAEAGFVVALVNFRGTHLSEGAYVGYRALQWGDLQDGYDTCEWLAAQDWCAGKVGTFGNSQGGYAQNYLAVTRPPHLVCQYMIDTGLSLFHEGYRIGGTTRPERFKGMDAVCRDPQDNRRLLAEWFRHPHYDEYWQAEDCTRHFDKMNVPCFTIGSWYDFMNQGSIASFQGRQHRGGAKSRGQQQLIIGPWLHGGRNKSNRVGDLVYPENASWPVHDHMVRWFNHFLKGEDNGVEREPTVRYYVMGAVGEPDAPGNTWRTAKDFPPPSTATSMFLHERGVLSKSSPKAKDSSTSYLSDPLHPMQIPGRGFPGARDAQPFERQTEVRTFTTAPLASPVEWTGRVQAELYVSSTARDTDFIVRISDVYPDGRSILIVDYPWRARYREGFDREVLMKPGEVNKIAFPVGWMSQIFNKGHRIRVTIASTGAPLYEPNPQTGRPLTIEFPADAVKATNTIHHNRQHASRIIAPVTKKTTSTSVLKLSDAVRDKCLETLRAGMKSDEFWPSIHAAEALTLAGRGNEVRSFLEPKLKTEKDDQKRCGLARELVRAGDWQKAAIMLDILAGDDPHGHVHAAESLYKVAEIGDGQSMRKAAGQTKNVKLQLMAKAALARCGNPLAMKWLRNKLGADDPETQRIAAWILARIGDASDVLQLRKQAAAAKDALTRCYHEHALATLGDRDGLRALEQNLASDDAALRTYAATFAGDARALNVANQLIHLLDDDNLDVRVRAAQSLLVLSQPARRENVAQLVYKATKKNPRYTEGSIVRLSDDSLLYAVTQFAGSGSDFSRAQIVARRSRDGGRTWSEPRVLQESTGKMNVMSVTLRRLHRPNEKTIAMFYLQKNSFDDLRVYVRLSQDEAESFGEPIRVTTDRGYHVMNNDRVTQLSSGRLLVPVASTADVRKVNHFVARCWISDDSGRTWRKGKGQVDQPKRGAMEPDVIELRDGRVLMIVRTQLGFIASSYSDDGGDTWSKPSRLSTLQAPEAPATIRRIPATGDLLLIWNNTYKPGAGHGGKRTPLTAATSSDEGRTWQNIRDLETSRDNTYAYTSLTFIKGHAVMSYWESNGGQLSSRFRSVPVAWFYAASSAK